MTPGEYILLNTVGGMFAGAIGAAAGETADKHPVLKGALFVGAFSGFPATAVAVTTYDRRLPANVNGGSFP